MGLSEHAGVKTIFADSVSLVSSNILRFPLQLLSIMIITRMLGAEGYGKITLYTMITGLGVTIVMDWTSGGLVRFACEEFEKDQKIHLVFWARNLIILICLLLCVTAGFFFTNNISTYIGIPEWSIFLLIFSLLSEAVFNYAGYILQSIRKMKEFAFIQFLGTATMIISLCIAWVVFEVNIFVVIIASVGALFLASVFAMAYIPKHILTPIKIDKNVLKELLLFSYPVIISVGAIYVINWIDVIIINKYFHSSDVGRYQLAFQCFSFASAIIAVISTVTIPIMISFKVKKREDLIIRYLEKISAQGILLWSVIVGIGLTFSEIVFTVFFGLDFQLSAFYFSILAIGLALNAISVFYTAVLMAYKLIKHAALISITVAVVKTVGDLALIPTIGTLGAVISTIVSIAVAALFYLIICQRHLKENLWWQIFMTLPAGVSLLLYLLIPGYLGVCAGFTGSILCGYLIAKRIKLFSINDLEFLDSIKMPLHLKKGIGLVYKYLSY